MAFRSKTLVILVVISFGCVAVVEWKKEKEWGAFSLYLRNANSTSPPTTKTASSSLVHKQSRVDVIDLLIDEGVYDVSSFENEAGVVPPFWDENATSPCKPDETTTLELGPCFGSHVAVDWHEQAKQNQNDAQLPRYTPLMTSTPHAMKTKNDWAGHCRPGFLIIGAGKCGTSSLYHYLTDHPRVIPAVEKQIHYFKYFSSRPMKWYLQHFPTTTSFLSSGALLTGEASPGYLPYPEVAKLVRERLARSGVKIITIGRDPIDRAYSSYRYSYVAPTLDKMRAGGLAHIPPNQPDAFYEPFLFSFQQMLKAELKQLQKCLAVPDGSAVAAARDQFGSDAVFVKEFAHRHREGLPPMATLGVECYGDGKTSKSSTMTHDGTGDALREQWVDLKRQFPDKVIINNNVHLQQSLLGRSLYVIPLEWWYVLFDHMDLYFVCTEELRDMTGEPLNRLGQFLGLPSYNFSSTVQKGAYNVGDNRGYDTETSWESFEAERRRDNDTSTEGERTDDYPLTQDFRRELQDFIRPYNERLFQLIGRRCDWSE